MSKKRSYGEKKAAGNMMYGPGCCGHRIDLNDPKIIDRQRARRAERDNPQKRGGQSSGQEAQ